MQMIDNQIIFLIDTIKEVLTTSPSYILNFLDIDRVLRLCREINDKSPNKMILNESALRVIGISVITSMIDTHYLRDYYMRELHQKIKQNY